MSTFRRYSKIPARNSDYVLTVGGLTEFRGGPRESTPWNRQALLVHSPPETTALLWIGRGVKESKRRGTRRQSIEERRVGAATKAHCVNRGTSSSEILPRHPRYASLDHWRGVACMIVVLYHSALFCYTFGHMEGISGGVVAVFARGWIGVPLFFVISGYCISATADSTRLKNRPVSTYFLRRLRRIYPPYWVVLLGSILFVLALHAIGLHDLVTGQFDDIVSIPDLGRLDLWHWAGNATLTETWREHVAGSTRCFVLGHAWTLCYEEQFYVVTGLLLLLMPRRFFLGIVLVTISVFLCTPLGLATRGFFWDGRWLLFAAGVGVYYAAN